MSKIIGPNLVTSGLVLHLDAANPKSYVSGSTTWFDMSGNNNNGTLTNGPGYSSANFGSIVFDGVDDFVNLQSFNISSGSTFTLSSWVYYAASSGPFPIIISENGNTYKMLFGIKIGSAANVGFNIYTSVGQTANTIAPIANAWYNPVATFTGSQLIIYVNGYVMSTVSIGSPFPGYSNGTWVGNGANGGNSFWKGNIPIVQIYNRALTAEEVQQNFNATRGRFGI